MDNYNNIKELKDTVNGLLSLYNSKKEENLVLQFEIKQLNNKLKETEEKIAQINKETESLKIAKTLTSGDSEDSSVAKAKITGLVREIDKCIALLNE